ncbi:carbohydrate esterase family 5 protein [Myriangium duriaei CBS 260.36]|uniref:Cutinase n=1 Tax=Myriangium duriaei CBS 260.36 TaxID=1168546 RepID=A0A9P4J556_9PEZI|nr:carbohydrate esterase family 5 protein [Myriangium duriaei CBS 260.36]
MKFNLALLGLVGLATAAPAPDKVKRDIDDIVRAATDSATSNELSGPCRPVTFIFARGTTETGNIGNDVGGPLSSALKAKYGTTYVATQGVDYSASLLGNLAAAGCSSDGINNFVSDINLAVSKCPNTQIVIGGYSQGAACLHAAVSKLSTASVGRINAAVTFGDTRNEQSGGQIPPIPSNRKEIFCNAGDGVCDGTLIVTAAHLQYAQDIPAAVSFISTLVH